MIIVFLQRRDVPRDAGRRWLPGGRDPHEPRHRHHTAADCELRLVTAAGRGQCGRQHTGGRVAVVDVEQDDPVGMLGLDGTDQAPDRGGAEVRRLAVRGGDSATGDHHEP